MRLAHVALLALDRLHLGANDLGALLKVGALRLALAEDEDDGLRASGSGVSSGKREELSWRESERRTRTVRSAPSPSPRPSPSARPSTPPAGDEAADDEAALLTTAVEPAAIERPGMLLGPSDAMDQVGLAVRGVYE